MQSELNSYTPSSLHALDFVTLDQILKTLDPFLDFKLAYKVGCCFGKLNTFQ